MAAEALLLIEQKEFARREDKDQKPATKTKPGHASGLRSEHQTKFKLAKPPKQEECHEKNESPEYSDSKKRQASTNKLIANDRHITDEINEKLSEQEIYQNKVVLTEQKNEMLKMITTKMPRLKSGNNYNKNKLFSPLQSNIYRDESAGSKVASHAKVEAASFRTINTRSNNCFHT